jgi:hypothetical protein
MTRKPPTPILQTTRIGSRRAGTRLNQPRAWRKVEPNRRMVVAGHHQRKGEPGAKERVLDRVVESEASSLLVILHYLLKNNTPFMGGNGAGLYAPNDPYCFRVAPGQISTSEARGQMR